MDIKKIIILLLILWLLFLFSMNTETFVPTEVLTNYKDQKVLIELFEKIIKLFKENDIEYWITGGTLLGAVRDKGMIPWDDDIDIGITQENINKLFKIKDKLEDADLEIVEWWGGYKIHDKKGKEIPNKNFNFPFIDIFPYIIENDKVYLSKEARDFWSDDVYNLKDLFPLKEYEWHHLTVLGPNEPNNYLDNSYKGWTKKAYKGYNHVLHKNERNIEFEIEYLNEKPYLWLYWENNEPGFITLCRKTVYKHCSKSFNIVLLNKDNIEKWLPEIKPLKNKLDKLILAHKVDIYRIMLLYKYGGLYLDSDIIVMTDLKEIIDKLKKYDFVGFGCTGTTCKNGYSKPSNWTLGARPNSYLMACIMNRQLELLNKQEIFEYHNLGKEVIWFCLDKLIKEQDYEYYHYDNTVDGTRDKEGHWVDSARVFSNEQIEYDNIDDFLFYVFYNSNINNKIKNMSENDLLNKDWNFTKMIKKSLYN